MGNCVKDRESELVARRWAKALMELALEDEGISKEDILDDLKEVSENICASNELSEVLNNPSVSQEEKQAVLSKLFENKLMPIVYKFIIAMNNKGRLGILGSVADEFEHQLEEMRNILRVSITSAIELSDDKKNDIRNRVAEKLQKDVILQWHVDSDIIGGLIFNIGETIIDNSIRHKLEDLKGQMSLRRS